MLRCSPSWKLVNGHSLSSSTIVLSGAPQVQVWLKTWPNPAILQWVNSKNFLLIRTNVKHSGSQLNWWRAVPHFREIPTDCWNSFEFISFQISCPFLPSYRHADKTETGSRSRLHGPTPNAWMRRLGEQRQQESRKYLTVNITTITRRISRSCLRSKQLRVTSFVKAREQSEFPGGGGGGVQPLGVGSPRANWYVQWYVWVAEGGEVLTVRSARWSDTREWTTISCFDGRSIFRCQDDDSPPIEKLVAVIASIWLRSTQNSAHGGWSVSATNTH